jgi:hypothetical protein
MNTGTPVADKNNQMCPKVADEVPLEQIPTQFFLAGTGVVHGYRLPKEVQLAALLEVIRNLGNKGFGNGLEYLCNLELEGMLSQNRHLNFYPYELPKELGPGLRWDDKVALVKEGEGTSDFNDSHLVRGFLLRDDASIIAFEEIHKARPTPASSFYRASLRVRILSEADLMSIVILRDLFGDFVELLAKAYQAEVSRIRGAESTLLRFQASLEATLVKSFSWR